MGLIGVQVDKVLEWGRSNHDLSWFRSAPWRRVALTLGTLGMLSRFVLAWKSIGCDDAKIWLKHAALIQEFGQRAAYELPPTGHQYNHPPLMGYWALLAGYMSDLDPHVFSLWLKVPGLLGELLAAWLIAKIWSKRGPDAGAWAFAAYGLCMPAILVSGYHCNTDTAYAALSLLAIYLLEERKRPLAAGLALGGALNVKLMPLFLIPVLFARCRSWRAARGAFIGLSLAALPYVPFLITSGRAMYEKMVRYNSLQLEWGVMAFFKAATGNKSFVSPTLTLLASELRQLAVDRARYWILGGAVLASLLCAWRRRDRPYELPAFAWALFLVLTPGFGVQYVVCVLPLLFVADIRRAILYSLCSGIMLALIYSARLDWSEIPWHALVQYHPFPPLATFFGILAWGVLLMFVLQCAVRFVGVGVAAEAEPITETSR